MKYKKLHCQNQMTFEIFSIYHNDIMNNDISNKILLLLRFFPIHFTNIEIESLC